MKDLILIILLLSFSGCLTAQQQAENLFLAHPEWSFQDKKDINNGTARIGMTQEMVLAARGYPYDINRTVGSWGVHEQWIYRFFIYKNIYHYQYLYFEDGTLTAYQH